MKTEKCVICGNEAKVWHGYVLGKERMALGNYIDKKIVAGFCETHSHIDSKLSCYGNYNSDFMGKCKNLFS